MFKALSRIGGGCREGAWGGGIPTRFTTKLVSSLRPSYQTQSKSFPSLNPPSLFTSSSSSFPTLQSPIPALLPSSIAHYHTSSISFVIVLCLFGLHFYVLLTSWHPVISALDPNVSLLFLSPILSFLLALLLLLLDPRSLPLYLYPSITKSRLSASLLLICWPLCASYGPLVFTLSMYFTMVH